MAVKGDSALAAIGSWYSRAWKACARHHWKIIGIGLLLELCGNLATRIPGGTLIYYYVILPPLMVGACRFNLKLVREEEAGFSDLFAGFDHFGRAWLTYIFWVLVTAAGVVLLVIPGVIWGVGYSLSLFAVLDRSLSAREALRFSGKITKGHRLKLLVATMIGVLPMAILFGTGLRTLGCGIWCWHMVSSNGKVIMDLGIGAFLLGGVIGPWTGLAWASAYDDLAMESRYADAPAVPAPI